MSNTIKELAEKIGEWADEIKVMPPDEEDRAKVVTLITNYLNERIDRGFVEHPENAKLKAEVIDANCRVTEVHALLTAENAKLKELLWKARNILQYIETDVETLKRINELDREITEVLKVDNKE